MFASDSYLHFILDHEKGLHFTDSLVPLGPKGYIWYWLRRREIARNILLLDIQPNGQLAIETFDSGSSRLFDVPKKSMLSFAKKEELPQTIAYRTYPLPSTTLTPQTLLSKLLTAAETSSGDTALVFSLDAFLYACHNADSKSEKLLLHRLESPAHRDRLFILLPPQAGRLMELITSPHMDNDLADRALAHLRGAATYGQMPLLESLSKQLGGQLHCLDQGPNEMMNLLLAEAASDPNSADTLEQLTDQAQYLALCHRHHAGILAPDENADLPHHDLNTLIRKPEFRQKLRRKTAALRTQYPHSPMEDAMRSQNLLPHSSSHPIYHDDLSNKILSLQLPDEFIRQSQVQWPAFLTQIRQQLTIIWNKPRNAAAVRSAMDLCISAHSAVSSKNWDTLDTVLRLLQFFARQICAPGNQADDLESIYRYSQEIIQICNYIYGERSFGLPSDFDQFIHTGILAGDKAHLESLKAHVHNTIQRFEHPGVTFTSISSELEEDRTRLLQQMEQANQFLQEQQKQEQAQREAQERQRREQEISSRYSADVYPELEPEDLDFSGKLPNDHDLLFD